jgi:hypothetical protein
MSNVVVTIQEYHVPIISAAQGPQGGPGPAGPPGPPGPVNNTAGATSVPGLTDVDLTTLSDGALLVYNTASSTWKSTTILEKQSVECGQY